MPTAYETYLAAKSGRSETAYQRYLRTKAGSGSANGLVDTPAQSTPEPTKRLGMGDFRQIERGGYTGEPMGVGDLRMIERNEAGARIPNEDASFLSPASVFKGAVSKLATLGERVNRGFFRPVAEKHARIQDVVEPGAERAVSRGMEYGARMSGDFAVEGIPGFANRFVNPEEYRSTAGAQAKEAGAGLLGGGKKFFAQAGEELHQTARDFGVTGEENPMRQIYHDLGADKAFDEAVAEYNQDPSGWLQTATIAKGLGKTGAGLARGVRRGFKPVEKASVEAGLPRGTMPVESVPETVAKSEPKTLTPQISPAENALPPRKVTPEGAAPVSPAKQPTVNTYYRGTNPGATERIKTGDAEWDSYLFVTDNTKSAKMYGDNVETINLKPDAKILREGTSDFVRVAGRWRKGESMLDYSSRAAKAAKDAGYDAIHFKRQTDVGTAILNRNAIEPPVSPQGAAKQPWEMTKGEYYANKAGEIAPINNPYSVVLTGGKTPGSVWHGTSGEGLLGILKDGEIRPRVSRGDKLGQSVVSMSQFPKAADDMGLISLKIKDRGYANRPEASRSVGRGNYVDGFEVASDKPIPLSDIEGAKITFGASESLSYRDPLTGKTLGEYKKLLEDNGIPVEVEQLKTHRQQVEQALASGKPVPPSVLVDYPDLKPPVSPAKQPTVKEPWEMQKEQFEKGVDAYVPELALGNQQHPYVTPEGKLTRPTLSHSDLPFRYNGTRDIHGFMEETGYVRLMGTRDELGVEMLGKPTPAQMKTIEISTPGPIRWDISNRSGKIQKSGVADNFKEFRSQMNREFRESDYPDLKPAVSPRGAKLSTKGKVALGAGAVATGAAAYQALNEDDREDVASAALGLGVLGTGLMRSPLKEGGGRKLTAKEMRAAKELNNPKLTGKETPGKINIDRMNLSAPEKQYAQVQIDRLKPHLEKMKGAKLTDQEVIDAAGDVKMTQEAIARSETLKRSAQILNARKNEAELLRREKVSPKELRSILETVRQVESVKTDLGREMQKLSISVDPELQSTRSALLTRLAKSDVDLSALEKKAAEYQAQGKSLDNPRHVAEFYREFIKPKAAEILDEYRYINMLSSPNTHIVNTTSNLIQGLIVRPGTRLYAGGIDAVGSKLTGAERNYYVRQVPAYYKGMLNSLSDAVKNVRDVMSGESLTLRPDLQNIPTNSKWTKWGYPVTRALEASDIFVRTLIEGAEKEALSYKAKRLGKELDLEDITAEAQHTASQTVFRGELDPSNATGQGWIKSKVFDAPASMLNRLRQLSPPFKWLVPFVQTPLNIAKQGFEYSPLGFAEFGVKDKTAQIAKASLGSTVFVGAGYIAMTNGSTWALPNGKKAREEFYAAGMKPYSLKIGDTWVSYSKLGPLAYPIALAAAMKYHFKDSPNALSDSNSDKVTAGLAEMAQFFSDQSYVQSLGNIIDAMQGATTGEWKGEVSQLIGGTGRQLIPLSALQGWVNGIIDPIYRKSEKDLSPEAILQNMQKNVIGLSTNLEPYKDRKGEISKRPFPVGNALFPFQVSPVDSTGAKTYQKNAEQLQKKRAFDQINDAIKEGRDTDAQAIIDNMKAQGIPVGTLDQFKSEYARKKTKLPKVATPKTPKIQSSVEPLPEIYSSTDIERIPKDLKVEVEVTRAKTGEKHTVKMNGREAVTELHKSLALYNQLLAYLNEGKAA